MKSLSVRLQRRAEKYEITIGSGLLAGLGSEMRTCLGSSTGRVAIVSNPTVFDLYGRLAGKSLRAADFKVARWLMPDGERHKSLRTLNQLLNFLADSGFERNDAIVALGGGVVCDLAGFAAATYMRGIALIQVPTTLLAQIDASVGGKTGVNSATGKNLVGTFYHPRAVIIDTDTLSTLPRREVTAGWCEAVKQGAVGGRRLFDQTRTFLNGDGKSDLAEIIAAHCKFKASVVSGDEREAFGRTDVRSRRILNFGHTVGHAIERVTNFRRFRHGEAVGYGMLAAAELSKHLGMLPASELESLRAAVRSCGTLPRADDLAISRIIQKLKSDKKSVAGVVNWVLLERIGRPRLVSGREIDSLHLRAAIRAGLKRTS